jgi:hypothetical protein
MIGFLEVGKYRSIECTLYEVALRHSQHSQIPLLLLARKPYYEKIDTTLFLQL